MKRSKSKSNESRENKPDSEESIWERAFDSMCLSLDRFGPSETLRILLPNAHKDKVVHQLLITYPGVVAMGNFLSGFRFKVKVSKRLFQKLKRGHCIL